MRHLLILLFLLIFKISAFSQSYTVKDVPDPKDRGNFYVSNPDGILTPEEEDQLNNMLENLEKETSNQVAVVALKSIGDEVPKNFITELFNTWHIGRRGKDNGLMVLLVLDQRRVEIEPGYGLEPILPDAVCVSISDQEMVPFFKQEQYGAGIIAGVQVLSSILKQPDNTALVASYKEKEFILTYKDRSDILFYMELATAFILFVSFWVRYSRKTFAHLYNMIPEGNRIYQEYAPISMGRWIFMYMVIPVSFYFALTELAYESFFWGVLFAFYCYLLIVLIESKFRHSTEVMRYPSEQDRYKGLDKLNQDIIWLVIFMPMPFLFYYVWQRSKKKQIRSHDRSCPKCSNPLQKLNENKDDAYLEKNQIKEEVLKSVDYDVWLCNSCHYHSVIAYNNLSTKYTNCEECNTIAVGFLNKYTISEATYSSTGLGKRTYECKNCKKQKEEEYTIPMLERDTSSSSSSSSSSSGSWGGGSSGGGGGGSSW